MFALKLIRYLVIGFLLVGIATGCTQEEEPIDNGTIMLTKETIKSLEKGILKGTPISLDKELTMEEIKKAWGEPDEHHDHEDIQTYVYVVEGQRIVIDEDELKTIYLVKVELVETKEEILDRMGKPAKRAGSILIYERGNVKLQFEKLNDKWYLILMKN